MRNRKLIALVLLVGGMALAEMPPVITADYVEARSHHVYTCGCLANSELVTDGREAIVAWRFQEGEFQGQSLRGAKAVAVLIGAGHLGLDGTPRKSALYLDTGGAAERRQALGALLRSEYGSVLGEVVAVHATPIELSSDAGETRVHIAGAVQVTMRPARLPEDAHPGSFSWYRPLVSTESAGLATSLLYQYAGTDFQRQWARYEAAINGYVGSVKLGRR